MKDNKTLICYVACTIIWALAALISSFGNYMVLTIIDFTTSILFMIATLQYCKKNK